MAQLMRLTMALPMACEPAPCLPPLSARGWIRPLSKSKWGNGPAGRLRRLSKNTFLVTTIRTPCLHLGFMLSSVFKWSYSPNTGHSLSTSPSFSFRHLQFWTSGFLDCLFQAWKCSLKASLFRPSTSSQFLKPSVGKPISRASVVCSHPPHSFSVIRFHPNAPTLIRKGYGKRFEITCSKNIIEIVDCGCEVETESGNGGGEEEEEEEEGGEKDLEIQSKKLESQGLWDQMKEIVKFTGPATGLWLCGPLMSIIDTAVIGQGSSVELAALGPGTVFCDYTSYVFMFLSIATSNMVATALARQDKSEVQHHISILLFLGLISGLLMLFFTKLWGSMALAAFAGPMNAHLVPAADSYIQIRGLAWPAVLVGWVAQSASLGMKDSWGPLKALAVASVVNGLGDVILCMVLGYGIAGAAWATTASQVIAAYMMISTLNKKGYDAFSISIPTFKELMSILGLAAPVFLTMMSKVGFYSLIVYFSTSMGTHTMAAHQVMIQTFCMCSVWGEPLSQTAQSFMPELIYGAGRSLDKARMLLKSLTIIGAILGSVLGVIGTCVPWLFPNIFTRDHIVIQEMHKVLIPYFMALAITPSTLSLEGTLLAGWDLKFISLTMTGCFSLGALLLLLVTSKGFSLQGCWIALVGFQWARFFIALWRLLSPNGMLYSNDLSRYKMEKLKAA